ncbi:MAG: argininosuccinate lyase [Coriobacteriia bacterium]|nr:argininosuccinate lyase [Coriobacteriia bacterium]
MPEDRKTPWGGRFGKPLDKFVEEFAASLPVDKRMWEADILGSLAHARMLAATGVIPPEDLAAIERGLSEIYREIREGRFEFVLADEDVHMAVERALIDKAGPAGGRLHTARSRNDQVALDERIHARDAVRELAEAATGLRATLLRLAEEHLGVVMPGYTHLQKAQPVLLSHHLLAYFWMLSRDVTRLRHAREAADAMPLGSAALAGTTFPIDRQAVADALGFSVVTANSLDAVSDRDFLVDLTYACALAMVHLSRLCEELVLWSAEEFGFVTMDDSFSTGSSIMPQKRNPDVAELVRGKTGRVLGDLQALLVMLKGLPLAYNKDMQEDKESAFDAIDTLRDCLRATDGMIGSMRVNSERMRRAALGGFMVATDLADHLAERGVPFRDAHEVVGRLVAECERRGIALQDLTPEEFAAAHPALAGVSEALDVDRAVARRTSEGGTGHDAVRAQLSRGRDVLAADEAWLESLAAE